MPVVTVYQDNLSCMALLARGRSGGERSRHIDIRYFWMKDRVDRGEAEIVHKGTSELYANVLTKPLQGSQFEYERGCLTGWPATEERAVEPSKGTRSVGFLVGLRRPSVCALRSQTIS
jgi:hypothetical protein